MDLSMLEEMFGHFRLLEHGELEVLLCEKQDEKTVSQSTFQRILHCLQQSSTPPHNIFKYIGERTIQDFFFSHGNVRSRIEAGRSPITIQKKKVSTAAARCVERPQYSFCFHLKQEHPTKNPSMAIPNCVRLQQAWEFTYKDAFRYTLKKVCTGNTKEQACKQEPTYEIEIEVIPHSAYLSESTNEFMAHSLVIKIMDLVGRFDFDGQTVDLHCVFDQSCARKYKKRKLKKENKS
jgi:hypothetical protein